MDERVYISLLLDFYGPLLTEKQQEYMDLYYNENLSLAEIAENDGISRQGVRDILVRAKATLIDSENRLGLAVKYDEQKKRVAEASSLLDEIARLNATRFKNAALLSLCNQLLDKLQEMKG